jgi:hypothetical protein
VKKLYPAMQDVESTYGPTNVHLQVYDDCAHVLPVLFAFTTPAKFCFRAIAGFCRHVTDMAKVPHAQAVSPISSSALGGPIMASPAGGSSLTSQGSFLPRGRSLRKKTSQKGVAISTKTAKKARSWNGQLSSSNSDPSPLSVTPGSGDTPDVGGPRFDGNRTQRTDSPHAGDDPHMYVEPFVSMLAFE